MNFECFCAAMAAQKHSIKINPPQDWGGMGGVDNFMANSIRVDRDTRGGSHSLRSLAEHPVGVGGDTKTAIASRPYTCR